MSEQLSYEYPAEVVEARWKRERERNQIFREMAALLNVARMEWPRQIEGTKWQEDCLDVLKRYRLSERGRDE